MFFFKGNAMLLSQMQCVINFSKRHHHFNCFIVLFVLKKELNAGSKYFWVIFSRYITGNILDQMSVVILNGNIHSLLLIPTSAIQSDCFIEFAFFLKVGG